MAKLIIRQGLATVHGNYTYILCGLKFGEMLNDDVTIISLEIVENHRDNGVLG